MKTISGERPEFYSIEKTFDNKLIVRFAENITEVEIDEISAFEYDEMVGEFPWSNSLAASIRQNPEKFLAKLKSING